jgi:histidinol dehydrogenase
MPRTVARVIDARERQPQQVVAELRRAGSYASGEVRDAARRIIEDVRERGDAAVQEYTQRFDGVRPDPLRVPAGEIERALEVLSSEAVESFTVAIENVRAFHKRELDRSWEMSRGGATTGQRVRPVRRAGVYVPGGHTGYPSTLVMAAVPALVAGVGEVCVCTPPGRNGSVSQPVLGVAGLLGLDEVYAVGGAQAVGAMAYGTESIPAVNRVVGPGNDYVTAAKLEVFGTVGIDAPQGPSEVMVIADASAFPEHVALDLMAQAEHLSGASAILLSTDDGLIEGVLPLLAGEPAEGITLVRVDDLRHAAELSNAFAPEHAHVISEDHEAVLDDLREVGMVAIGDSSPVALGDYVAGPSHALPTGGTAAWASPLGTHDFTVRTNYIHFTGDALGATGPHAERLARLEGFTNHADSVGTRLRRDRKV